MMNVLATPLITPVSLSADVRHFENRIDPLHAKTRSAEKVKYNGKTWQPFCLLNQRRALRHISSQYLDH
jgi:hypothetical protein